MKGGPQNKKSKNNASYSCNKRALFADLIHREADYCSEAKTKKNRLSPKQGMHRNLPRWGLNYYVRAPAFRGASTFRMARNANFVSGERGRGCLEIKVDARVVKNFELIQQRMSARKTRNVCTPGKPRRNSLLRENANVAKIARMGHIILRLHTTCGPKLRRR